MKRRLFAAITAVMGIGLGFVGIELAAIAWLTIEDGHFTPAAELFERTQNTFIRDITRGSSCRYVDALFPHPYVAFVHHGNPPCGGTNINNAGLFNDDYPNVHRSDRFVVLLTGGSVASDVAQYRTRPAPRFLEEELNRRFVSPSGKPFLVLNGGDGGWKQPQQFILFSLYASALDGVVTLDGFNEHYAFLPDNHDRLERPANNFIDINPFVDEQRFGDAAIGWVIGHIAGVLSNNRLLRHSHAAYMVVRSIESMARSKDVARSTRKTTVSSLFALPADIAADPDRMFAFQIELYRKYARGIELLARRYNVKSAYFLQPVPAWGKILTPDEKANAGDLSYGPLYRRIVEGMLSLRDEGMPVFDLGDLVKDERERLYADHIHFISDRYDSHSRGYRLMAIRMAELIGQAWGLAPKN